METEKYDKLRLDELWSLAHEMGFKVMVHDDLGVRGTCTAAVRRTDTFGKAEADTPVLALALALRSTEPVRPVANHQPSGQSNLFAPRKLGEDELLAAIGES